MLNKRLLYCFLLIIVSNPFAQVHAQDSTAHTGAFLQLNWSNDFLNQTDRYFSNGFDGMFVHRFMDRAPTRYFLAGIKNADEVYHGITLVHHFFTPDNLFETDILTTDRPYASYLLLGHRKTQFSQQRKIKFQSELQVGILGRYSGGEALQNNLHELFPASSPSLGWENQLSPDLALMYTMEVEKGLFTNPYFEMIPKAAVRVGVPYTDFNTGIRFRAGRLNDNFSSFGLKAGQRPFFYVFAEMNGRLVVYNATLQGGLLNDHAHTLDRIHPWLFQTDAGLAVGLKKWRMEYLLSTISPEYPGGQHHKWSAFRFILAI